MAATALIDIGELLASNPDVYGGWVTIRDRRLPVARLGFQHVDEGYSADALATDWDLSLAEVHAALSYFFAHREQIEREVAEYDAETDRIIAAEQAAAKGG